MSAPTRCDDLTNNLYAGNQYLVSLNLLLNTLSTIFNNIINDPDYTADTTASEKSQISSIIAGLNAAITSCIQIQYTVTPTAGSNGSINPNTAQTVNFNGSIMFTAIPNVGYQVSAWKVNGTTVATSGLSYNLANITSNETIEVDFSAV